MKHPHKKIAAFAAAITLAVASLSACTSAADKASQNLSTAADNFEIQRQIVFYDTWTGDAVAEFDGRCSIGNSDRSGQVSITCEVAPGQFEKHFLGLNGQMSWFALQSAPAAVSTFHTRVIWRPKTIIPDIGIDNSGN